MNRFNALAVVGFSMFFTIVAVGCSSVPKQVRAQDETFSFHEASEYKGAVNESGLLVHAQIPDKKEQKRLFAFHLSSKGITPVLLTVTNKSKERIIVEAYSASLDAQKVLKIEAVTAGLYENAAGVLIATNVLSLGGATLGGANRANQNTIQTQIP